MANVRLSLAVGDYEHVRDLLSGDVRAEGIDITALRTPIEELLYRFLRLEEWHVSEMGLGPYASLVSRGHTGMVALPVFTSRAFRHSSIYLRNDSRIASPSELSGKRVGVPEWAMTAVVYARALLQHVHRVDLRSIEWVQAGVNEPGRIDKMNLQLPGYRITPVPTRSLSEMLLAGDLDAILSARAPQPFLKRDPRITRAYEDIFAEEMDYWKRNKIFPIMHLMVIRRDIYEENRWIAMNLYKAFEEAKRRALERIRDVTASHFPIPWLPHHVALAQAEMGEDFWPYGIAANRSSLEAFCQYAFEQEVCNRHLGADELFPPEVQALSRV